MKAHIILGSKSDMHVADKITTVLDELGIEYQVDICSAHREPARLDSIIKKSDADLFIGVAGLSAALPGYIASRTLRPVIGVPVSGKLNLDAILSIVQMPKGVPVAAVGLDNGVNAALLAAEILAIKDDTVAEKVKKYRGMSDV